MRRSTRISQACFGRDRRQAPDRFGGQLERHGRRRQDRDRRARDKVVTDADATFQTASVDKKTVETGMGGPLEEVAVSPAVVQPSNADPEHDARGIPVISDVAFVPPGFNGIGGAVGGPDEGTAESYPACTATVTDNCIQLYERECARRWPVRRPASWRRKARRRPWAVLMSPSTPTAPSWR